MSNMTVYPEMVGMNSAYDSDCAKAMWDFAKFEASQGRIVELVSREQTFSPADVANLVGVSRATVQRRIMDGTISASKRGAHWRVSDSEVRRYSRLVMRQTAELLGDGYDF
ncbi:MAG: helix-turn-helix domain-containing protein [Propionibacteriaceae bacterium]|nr:helix-turn-helix domain-containing protein [Propionibacteriaceae bacterium]